MIATSRRRLLIIVLLLLTSTVGAATPPPDLPFQEFRWKAISASKPAPALHIGHIAVQFERTKLASVQAAIGLGAMSHQGDAGESLYWLCYAIPNPAGPARLWVISHGEMGGNDHVVTEVALRRVESSDPGQDCPALPRALRSVVIGRGVVLGGPEEQATKYLGKPSFQKDDWKVFAFERDVPARCGPNAANLANWLFVASKRGRVVEIRAGQVTTC